MTKGTRGTQGSGAGTSEADPVFTELWKAEGAAQEVRVIWDILGKSSSKVKGKEIQLKLEICMP